MVIIGCLSIKKKKKKVFIFNRLLGFYKGILPPILAETPKRAVKVKTSYFLL